MEGVSWHYVFDIECDREFIIDRACLEFGVIVVSVFTEVRSGCESGTVNCESDTMRELLPSNNDSVSDTKLQSFFILEKLSN
jgi:hypothetical protein